MSHSGTGGGLLGSGRVEAAGVGVDVADGAEAGVGVDVAAVDGVGRVAAAGVDGGIIAACWACCRTTWSL